LSGHLGIVKIQCIIGKRDLLPNTFKQLPFLLALGCEVGFIILKSYTLLLPGLIRRLATERTKAAKHPWQADLKKHVDDLVCHSEREHLVLQSSRVETCASVQSVGFP
jgi:hypothetical protein